MIQKTDINRAHHVQLKSSATGELYSLSAVLTDVFDLKDLFVHHEVLHPGRRSSGTHFHSHREEMVFVIEGHVTVWLNGDEAVIGPGEMVAFHPGPENAHYVENNTQLVARLLVIASNPEADTVEFVNSLSLQEAD